MLKLCFWHFWDQEGQRASLSPRWLNCPQNCGPAIRKGGPGALISKGFVAHKYPLPSKPPAKGRCGTTARVCRTGHTCEEQALRESSEAVKEERGLESQTTGMQKGERMSSNTRMKTKKAMVNRLKEGKERKSGNNLERKRERVHQERSCWGWEGVTKKVRRQEWKEQCPRLRDQHMQKCDRGWYSDQLRWRGVSWAVVVRGGKVKS